MTLRLKKKKKKKKIDFTLTHFPSSVYDHSCERVIIQKWREADLRQKYIFFLFLKLTLLPPKKYQRGCTNYGSLNSSVSNPFWPFIFSRMHLSFWEDCDNHGLEFVIKEQVKFVIAPFIKLEKGKSGKCLSYSSQSFQNWPKDASSLPENIIHEICIYKITRSMIDWICSYLLAPRPATSLVKN